MFQRILNKDILAVLIISLLAMITTIASEIKINKFSYQKIAEEVKDVLNINENLLKESKFPEVLTQIFSPLPIPHPKVEQPEVVIPQIVNEPPKDPYENYKNELKNYTGFGLIKDNGKIKVFLAKGDETFMLGVGDIIKDKLIIKEITANYVIVGLIDDSEFHENIRINK